MVSLASSSFLRRGVAACAIATAVTGVWAQPDGPTHICGGIGSDESAAMRSQMKDHPLSLMFARPDGAFLADVDVTIQDATTAAPAYVFRARGPLCLVDLPTGAYTVQATSGGVTKNMPVTIASAPKTVDFRF
ncbi:carboxypeptidase regulatory-like domain-containing protein [Variovorax sp. dw_308]|uniref:carboxypeptidase regulatory-like domain-containing protein n=1 Tax=Variovorax sp. dw_308 TaxID=2721546 RepID=UPI001C490593|nr:carboxypeptidase regulatory-like domain-containing protein [Variovorax sp. dw_308]